jgi:phage/plasmid-like protein (TIGR03299 family)
MAVSSNVLQIETSATVGKCPWGIGTEVSNDLTPIQMMQKAGVDWTVEKIPSFVNHNGEQVATGMEALVRSTDSKVLTQVGGNWNPVQNEQAFEFFNDYCSAGDMEMSSAGSLKDGKMVYALAKVKESFDILGGDQVDSYLLFSNPHEYGKSIDVRFTPVRVTCMNSLALALKGTSVNSTKINHRKAFDPEQVKVTMGLAHEKFDQYKVMAELLSKRQFTADTLIQYYNSLFPSQAPAAEVKTYNDLAPNAKKAFELLETQPGAEYGRGSWWQAFNSVTYLTDHQLGRSADGRMTSAWFGANQVKKKRAAELAVEMAVS